MLIDQTVFDGGLQMAAALGVLFLSQVVYALYGFGSGMLAVAVLAFVFPDLSHVVVLLLFVTLPTEVFVVVRDRRHIAVGELAGLVPGLAIGAVVGTLLLRAGARAGWLVPTLGVVLMLVAVHLLLQAEDARARRLPPGSALAAGALGGVLGGLFGMAAPPVIVYLRARGLERRAFRAGLLALFLLTSLVRLPSVLLTGLAGGAMLRSAALVVPAGLAGLAVGHHLHVRVSERRFRQGVAWVLGVLGLLLVLRG